jgi:hypothetical protein
MQLRYLVSIHAIKMQSMKARFSVLVVLAIVSTATSAAAQWTEVKDVNGKVHTIYKTPVPTPSSGSYSGGTKSSSGSSSPEPAGPRRTTTYTPRAETRSEDELAMDMHIYKREFDAFYTVYNNPASKFTEGKGKPLAYLLGTMCNTEDRNTEQLPKIYALYQEVLAYTKRFSEDFSYTHFTFFELTDLSGTPFVVARACVQQKDYQAAINLYRTSTHFGKDPKDVASGLEKRETQRFISYINYFSGRCYEALGQKENAEYLLSRSKGFKSEWSALTAE